VYSNEETETGKESTSFQQHMNNIKMINNNLREKNSEILRNLQSLREELEMKNRIRQRRLKDEYTDLAENSRSFLSSSKSRNLQYARGLSSYYSALTPYEKEFIYQKRINQLKPISTTSIFINHDSPTNKSSNSKFLF
jgi:hypothetical protein